MHAVPSKMETVIQGEQLQVEIVELQEKGSQCMVSSGHLSISIVDEVLHSHSHVFKGQQLHTLGTDTDIINVAMQK